LDNAEAVKQEFVADFKNSFVFKFISGNRILYLAIPFEKIQSSTDKAIIAQTIELSKLTSTSDFDQLIQLKDSTFSASGLALSAFNYLNNPNYGKFYSVMQTSALTTLLVSKARLLLPSDILNVKLKADSIFPPFSPDYASTGDFLCWGSASYGMVSFC
jgi:hypothetical protein